MAGLGLGKLGKVFQRSVLLYPFVFLAIVVPNLLLGGYGFIALRSQQDTMGRRLGAAYDGLLNQARIVFRTELQRQLDALEQYVDENARRLRAATREEIEAGLTGMAQHPQVISAWIAVGAPNDEVRLEAPIDVVDSPDRPTGADPAFVATIWPALKRRLPADRTRDHAIGMPDGTTTVAMVVQLIPPDLPATLPMWVVLVLDRGALATDVLAASTAGTQLGPGVTIGVVPTPQTGFDQAELDGHTLLAHRQLTRTVLADSSLVVRYDPTDATRSPQPTDTSTAVYLALTAGFVPIVWIGSFFLVRALIREIKEAKQKTDFVSRVTHELKTPLTSIRLFTETLQMGSAQSPEDVRRCIDVIHSESERLSKLIERVLDFNKIEAGNKVYHFRVDDIETVVRDTIDFFRKQALQSGCVIRLYIERSLPSLTFDRDAVREVLLNLLENAVKYSVGEKMVAIRVVRYRFQEAEAVQIQVIDNGVGIRREDLPQVFDKFYRVDDTLTKGIDGSGLGLTLSREIARAHGGDIVVESRHGRGSKFSLILPIQAPKPE
jgi:signal transduction histidine kinase